MPKKTKRRSRSVIIEAVKVRKVKGGVTITLIPRKG